MRQFVGCHTKPAGYYAILDSFLIGVSDQMINLAAHDSRAAVLVQSLEKRLDLLVGNQIDLDGIEVNIDLTALDPASELGFDFQDSAQLPN